MNAVLLASYPPVPVSIVLAVLAWAVLAIVEWRTRRG